MNHKLIIDYEDGRINISGPINDKVLCFGLLEAAKDAVRDYVAKNQIIAPHPLLNLQALRDKNGT